MNKVLMIGNLTKAPEIVTLETGKVANFTIAINKGEDVDFVPCKAFNKTAELLEKFTKKGDKIGIVGAFNAKAYKYKGENRVDYSIIVNEVNLLTPKAKEE